MDQFAGPRYLGLWPKVKIGKRISFTLRSPGRGKMIAPRRYSSCFTNRYGELWEFEYDPSKQEGVLRGSDVDWHEYRVVGGRALGLILNAEEIEWLHDAWVEASGGE